MVFWRFFRIFRLFLGLFFSGIGPALRLGGILLESKTASKPFLKYPIHPTLTIFFPSFLISAHFHSPLTLPTLPASIPTFIIFDNSLNNSPTIYLQPLLPLASTEFKLFRAIYPIFGT